MMLQYFKQIFLDFLESSSSSLLTTTPAWHQSWAAAMVAEPYSVESISARLSALLDGKTVGDATGISIWEGRRSALESFVQNVDWTFKPEAFDAVWHAVFKVAKRLGCTEKIRDATYYWTENFLLYEAIDAIPPEPGDTDSDSDLLPDGYDNTWISAAVGDARLFALGYGYSAFAWNAFLDGLGLGGEDINSDSMRIGSCGQLLGAGQRLKLFIYGGGNSYKTKGFAGRYLDASPVDEGTGDEVWTKVLNALDEQQKDAGPRAVALLKRTKNHLESNSSDLTSVEVANTIWPKVIFTCIQSAPS